jgi:hypothetical protein
MSNKSGFQNKKKKRVREEEGKEGRGLGGGGALHSSLGSTH